MSGADIAFLIGYFLGMAVGAYLMYNSIKKKLK